MQIAKTSDLDMSQMSSIHLAVIKLRKWKASLLTEPPPVVAVSLPEGPDTTHLDQKPCNDSERNPSNRLVFQLKFAAC